MLLDSFSTLIVPENESIPQCTYSQILAALTVSAVSLVVGYSSAYTSPAVSSLTDRNITTFEVPKQMISWIGSLLPLSAFVGGLAGGPLIQYLGRRTTILAISIPFITSWLIISFAINITMILVGRSLEGFCVGIASLCLPIYLSETVHAEIRGKLGLLPSAFGNVGILICFIVGAFLNWSYLALLGAALPILFTILTFLIPESPRWYISQNKEEHARKALTWLRGKNADIEKELIELINSLSHTSELRKQNTLVLLFQKDHIKPVVISLGLMFFQQFSGINAVIFYTVSIFQAAGSTIDGKLCTIIVGFVNLLSTFVATALIDRLGRKLLLCTSELIMTITLAILGVFFYLKTIGIEISNMGWLPLLIFIIYFIGFGIGFGPIPWLMMGEILPHKIRGGAASVVTSFNWLCTFLVTKTFRALAESIGTYGTAWLYASICCCGMLFVAFFVPETRGETLEDIEKKMKNKVRKVSSLANLKPLSTNL